MLLLKPGKVTAQQIVGQFVYFSKTLLRGRKIARVRRTSNESKMFLRGYDNTQLRKVLQPDRIAPEKCPPWNSQIQVGKTFPLGPIRWRECLGTFIRYRSALFLNFLICRKFRTLVFGHRFKVCTAEQDFSWFLRGHKNSYAFKAHLERKQSNDADNSERTCWQWDSIG